MRDTLTVIGIVVTMVGTAFAFFVGFPQPDLGKDHSIMQESYDPDEADRLRVRQRRLSFVGLTLLLVGATIEIIGVVL